MSISAYVGLPGHGKSFGVVQHVIMPALKNKRTVFTNIPMNKDKCLERFNHTVIQFDMQDLIDNPKWFTEVFTPGALFVVDELWRLWPAGIKVADINPNHKEFLAEHRHLVGDGGKSTEIFFVTQDLTQLASFCTLLVETTFRVVKMTKLGSAKRFRVDVFSGSQKGSNPPLSKRQREIYGKFTKDVYELYISHTKSDEGAGDETRTDGRFNVLGGIGFKLMGLGFIALAIFIYYSGKSFLSDNALTANLIESSNTVDLQPKSNEQLLSEIEKKVNEDAQLRTGLVPVQPTAQKIESVTPPINKLDIVSLTGSVFIIGHIEDVYFFRLKKGDTFADLTNLDLVGLGYELETVSDCLIKITGFEKLHFTMCEDNSNTNDFIRSAIN